MGIEVVAQLKICANEEILKAAYNAAMVLLYWELWASPLCVNISYFTWFHIFVVVLSNNFKKITPNKVVT